jgi:hypothetical protein
VTARASEPDCRTRIGVLENPRVGSGDGDLQRPAYSDSHKRRMDDSLPSPARSSRLAAAEQDLEYARPAARACPVMRSAATILTTSTWRTDV